MEACFSQLTLDVIGKAVFNYDFDALTTSSPVIQVRLAALCITSGIIMCTFVRSCHTREGLKAAHDRGKRVLALSEAEMAPSDVLKLPSCANWRHEKLSLQSTYHAGGVHSS